MNRNSKVMSIVAVAVCVVALSVGFAAFSNTLTISSGATVKPNESDFKVEFSTSADSVVYGFVTPTAEDYNYDGNTSATGAKIEIKEGETTISGLSANFTEPGDRVAYTFYVHNTGKYNAYFNEYRVNNIEGKDVIKECKTDSGEENNKLEELCNGIVVAVGGYIGADKDLCSYESVFFESLGITPSFPVNDHNCFLGTENHKVGQVNVYIDYMSEVRIDEPITIEFGDIELDFASVSTTGY